MIITGIFSAATCTSETRQWVSADVITWNVCKRDVIKKEEKISIILPVEETLQAYITLFQHSLWPTGSFVANHSFSKNTTLRSREKIFPFLPIRIYIIRQINDMYSPSVITVSPFGILKHIKIGKHVKTSWLFLRHNKPYRLPLLQIICCCQFISNKAVVV